jgi:hypothetical protein
MDKEQYLEAVKTLREAIKEIGPNNRARKRWSRQARSHSDRGLPFNETQPEKISREGGLRATLLCMILAHSRGRLHCKIMGRGADRVEMTPALQRKYVERAIADEERYERMRAQYECRSTWPDPNLTEAERALAKELIDDFGRERHRGVGEDDRDGPGSSQEVAAGG